MDLQNQPLDLRIRVDNIIEKPKINLMDLPTEMLVHVVSFISSKKLKNFGLVNKKCRDIYQHTLNGRFTESVDLRKFFGGKTSEQNQMLERVQNLDYRNVNLNMCYYMSPDFITRLILKESVREVDLIECDCTPEVIEIIAQLNLTSLSISLSTNWRNFFIFNNQRNENYFLNGLKKLELFHRYRSLLLMDHVSRYVLPHCHQLRRLKLFTLATFIVYEDDTNETFELSAFTTLYFTPTPVPQLENLILDFHNRRDISHWIINFLKIILHKKTLPLKNLYLGQQTARVVLSGVLCKQHLSLEHADTFCFSTCKMDSLSDAKNIENYVVESLLKSTKCKKIFMENLKIDDFSQFTQAFVNSGNTSIEEISFKGSVIEKGICNFIWNISIQNPGITFLDISLACGPNATINNAAIFFSVANLTNLRTLYVVPSMLSHTRCVSFPKAPCLEIVLKASIVGVSRHCKYLRNLRIVDPKGHCHQALISSDILSCIKYFERLKELYLVNFSIEERREDSALLEIVRSCTELKYLHIREILNTTGFDELLVYAKQIKHFFIQQDFRMTKTFIDNLSRCTQLEKVFIRPFYNHEDAEMLKYLAESVKNLPKLQLLSSTDMDYLLEDCFRSAFDEILERQPWFFLDHMDDNVLPIVHHEFLQYS